MRALHKILSAHILLAALPSDTRQCVHSRGVIKKSVCSRDAGTGKLEERMWEEMLRVTVKAKKNTEQNVAVLPEHGECQLHKGSY